MFPMGLQLQLIARIGKEKTEPMANPSTRQKDIIVPAKPLLTPSTCGAAIIVNEPM